MGQYFLPKAQVVVDLLLCVENVPGKDAVWQCGHFWGSMPEYPVA